VAPVAPVVPVAPVAPLLPRAILPSIGFSLLIIPAPAFARPLKAHILLQLPVVVEAAAVVVVPARAVGVVAPLSTENFFRVIASVGI